MPIDLFNHHKIFRCVIKHLRKSIARLLKIRRLRHRRHLINKKSQINPHQQRPIEADKEQASELTRASKYLATRFGGQKRLFSSYGS